MKAITEILDELIFAILLKDVQIELDEDELNKLRTKVEEIEEYITLYDEKHNYRDIATR